MRFLVQSVVQSWCSRPFWCLKRAPDSNLKSGPEAAFAAFAAFAASGLCCGMLKRAGIRRANRVFLALDDWQAAVIKAELKA